MRNGVQAFLDDLGAEHQNVWLRPRLPRARSSRARCPSFGPELIPQSYCASKHDRILVFQQRADQRRR